MGDLGSPRRYYLRKRQNSRYLDDGFDGVWRSKQEAQPGPTPLPSDMPYLPQLTEAGYATLEDLIGADEHELERAAQLSPYETRTVLERLALLVSEQQIP